MADYSWEQIVGFAQRGECWLCGRTGFKKLSQHLAMKHDLPADAVRERYGLKWGQGLCSPEFSEQNRERYYENGLSEVLGARGSAQRPPRSRMQAQTRAAMTGIANRADVRSKFADRRDTAEFELARRRGLKESEAAATQRAAARDAAAASRRIYQRCTVCGGECPTRKRLTCSDECRRLARVRENRKKAITHPCTVCGADVVGNSRRTCSEACRHEAQSRGARELNNRSRSGE